MKSYKSVPELRNKHETSKVFELRSALREIRRFYKKPKTIKMTYDYWCRLAAEVEAVVAIKFDSEKATFMGVPIEITDAVERFEIEHSGI